MAKALAIQIQFCSWLKYDLVNFFVGVTKSSSSLDFSIFFVEASSSPLSNYLFISIFYITSNQFLCNPWTVTPIHVPCESYHIFFFWWLSHFLFQIRISWWFFGPLVQPRGTYKLVTSSSLPCIWQKSKNLIYLYIMKSTMYILHYYALVLEFI